VAVGQVFSEYFGFPCQFPFHRLLHIHHHLSSGAGTIGQIVADVPSGLVSPHAKKLKKKKASLSASLSLSGFKRLSCHMSQARYDCHQCCRMDREGDRKILRNVGNINYFGAGETLSQSRNFPEHAAMCIFFAGCLTTLGVYRQSRMYGVRQ
jgi:hypothetical protein